MRQGCVMPPLFMDNVKDIDWLGKGVSLCQHGYNWEINVQLFADDCVLVNDLKKTTCFGTSV